MYVVCLLLYYKGTYYTEDKYTCKCYILAALFVNCTINVSCSLVEL